MEKIKNIIPDYQDGEFMSPKSGAKLASLFGLDRAESQGNESFQFTAPKQPKKSCGVLGPPPPPCAPAVLFATAVHAFCFVNGQYVKQGKIGAAILGNHVTKEYKILLYGSKQKQITTARIHRGFVLTVQPCNYVTFYDEQEQNWSILFDSEKARPEFCREVCLARWNSEASSDSLVTQDLVQGEGQAVGVGDAVEVSCSGWLLQNHCLGQICDFNVGAEKLQRVRLGARKAVRGWEDGMLGMQKGGRRLLIVPPGLVYGSKGVPDHVPANSTLVFDVEIHRVKFSKDRQGRGSADIFSTSSGICSDTQREENSQLGTTDTDESKDRGPYGKVESVDECQTTSDASKAKLISRIAKMGQPMLPFLTGAVPAQPEPSDSDTERVSVQDASESELLCNPCPSSKPTHMLCSSPSVSDQPDDSQKQEEDSSPAQDFKPCSFRQSSHFPSQLNSFTSIHPSQHISWQTPDFTSLLMSDARQQNAEILMAIEKVAHGVDQLTCKVDHLQKECHFSFGLSSVSLETNMMLYNIQRIVQGSMCLKKDVQEKSSQVEEQKPKIGELSEQNKRYVEQQHNQTRHHQTEHEKVHLSGELSSSSTHSRQLQQELVNLQQRAAGIQAELSEALSDKHKHCAQISLLEARVEELVKQREQSEQQWRTEKQKCKEMEATIRNMEEEMQDLRTERENLDQVLSDRKRKWQTEREAAGEYPRGQQETSQLLVLLRKASDSTEPLVKQAELEVGWQKKCDATLEEQKKLEGMNTELQEQYEDLKKTSQNQKKQFETQLVVQVKRMMNEVFQSLRKEFDQKESYSGHAALVILQNTIKSVTMKLLTEPLELESGAEEDLSIEEVFSNGNVQ